VTARARLFLTYAVVGPVAGALLYVAFSALAGALDWRTNLFIAPAALGASIVEGLSRAGWQIAATSPLSLTPAFATAWLTWRRVEREGSCPWWLSCLYGALTSGPPGALFLWAARAAYPEMTIIPHPLPGGCLIAAIGFVGTLLCYHIYVYWHSNHL